MSVWTDTKLTYANKFKEVSILNCFENEQFSCKNNLCFQEWLELSILELKL